MGDNMLVKFTVSNYRGFLNPITIDFTEKHDYKFNTDCVKNGLLSKAIIYGKNSSGKSNLGYAIFDIVGLLTDKRVQDSPQDPTCFLNADSNEKYACFEYVFKKNDDIIKYTYKKTSLFEICYEEMTVNDEIIYSYDFDSSNRMTGNLEKIFAENLNFEYYDRNLPVLRYIANNTNQPEDSIVRFVMDFVSNMLWFRSLQRGNGFIGFTNVIDNLESWIIQNNYIHDFEIFLKEMSDIDVKLEAANVIGQNGHQVLLEKHKNTSLLFDNVASSGTQALKLFFYWSKVMEKVSFLFIDEFDAFYHFELSKNIILWMRKLNNVQAVFTTHNSYLAANDVLRPDCYFVLNNGKLESFADSTDRELREGHNLEKLLRSGEFDGKK